MTKTTPYKSYNLQLTLITLLTVLSIIDFEITHTAMWLGLAEEVNPILSNIIDLTATTWSILWVKAVAACFFVTVFFTTSDNEVWETKMTPVLIMLNIMYLCIITYSSIMLFLLS